MKKLYFLLLSVFLFNAIHAQCPVINSAMVNSCGSSEGVNEFIVFTTTASAATSAYTLYYGSNTPATNSPTGILAGANAAPKTGTGTITSSTGCTINAVTSSSTVIPSGSVVIFIPADFDAQYDVSALCASGTIYVVYITRGSNWSAMGTLANNPSDDRYIQIVNGSNTCTSQIRTFTAGWPSNIDGNAVSWNASGTPTYVNNGCTVIPPPPGVTINPSTPVSVCQGVTSANITYTSTGNPDKYTLSWNAAAQAAGFVNVTNATLTSSPLVITVPATAVVGTSYTASLVATNTTNSVSSTAQNITVTIIGKPVVPNIIGITSICESYTYYSLQNATAGGVWSSNNTAIATVSNTGALTGVTPGGATITYTVTNTCGSTASSPFNITVTSKPIVAEISGTSNICTGSTVPFTNTTPGGTWSSSNGSAATVDNSGNVTGVTSGSTVISYSVSNSCGTTTKTFSVTVGNSITLPNITGSSTVCVGAATTLSNTTTGGTWSSSNTAVATIDASGSVTGTTTGTSTITYSVTSSCGNASKTFVITVNDKPVVADITGTPSLCVAATVNLSSTTTGGTWSSSNTTVATVSNTGVVTSVTAGSATISYAVTNSCGTTTKTFAITVNDKPVVADISGSANLCIAATGTLSSTTTGGTWSSSNTATATINASGVVTGIANGSTTISYTVTNTCGSTTKTFALTVSDKPVVANISGTPSLCAAATTTLTNTTNGGTWSSSNTAIATVNSSGVVTGVASGTTNINYTVTNTCGSTTKSFAVTISDKPIVADITGPTTVNPNATITLTDATTGGTWSSSNTTIATINASGVVTGLTSGTVTISYSVTNGCGTTVKTYSIKVSDFDDIFIPNVFSPNGDGNNDFFQVYGTIIAGLELKIFNQWGEMIFETKDMSNKWDGTYKGKKQPMGVYVYVAKIKVQNGTIVTKKGSINLIR